MLRLFGHPSHICNDLRLPCQTAAAFWHRAHAFFTEAVIAVARVLTDNGPCYRSHLWRDTLADAGITHKRTRPYRPQTNGKVEQFNRTLMDEWAYTRPYRSEQERRDAFPGWLPHRQSPPRTHRAEGPTASQPRHQPHGAVHAENFEAFVTGLVMPSTKVEPYRSPTARGHG